MKTPFPPQPPTLHYTLFEKLQIFSFSNQFEKFKKLWNSAMKFLKSPKITLEKNRENLIVCNTKATKKAAKANQKTSRVLYHTFATTILLLLLRLLFYCKYCNDYDIEGMHNRQKKSSFIFFQIIEVKLFFSVIKWKMRTFFAPSFHSKKSVCTLEFEKVHTQQLVQMDQKDPFICTKKMFRFKSFKAFRPLK